MRRDRSLAVLCVMIPVVPLLLLAGCGGNDSGHLGGGGGGGGGENPPTGGTSTIRGFVSSAVNSALRVSGAVIKVDSTSRQTTSATSDGTFALTGVPAGSVTLSVSFPSGTFHDQRLTLTAPAKTTVRLDIAAVPISTQVPTEVTLNPTTAEVDRGGQVQFVPEVRTFGLVVNVLPSFVLAGEVGTINASGLFTGTKEGSGAITAIAGAASAGATVKVVAPRAPMLGTLFVTPYQLPADGGDVRIAVTITSGAGVKSVIGQIKRPNGTSVIADLNLEPGGGNRKNGTWFLEFPAPANNNPADSEGHQLTQVYSVRVTAKDVDGRTVTSAWEDFSVAGLDSPPTPPPSS